MERAALFRAAGPAGAGFGGLIYENHLGIIGAVRVITSLEPRLALVSEFGEELAPVQEELVELVRKIVEEYCKDAGKPHIKVLPADLPFVYRVWDRTACCIFTEDDPFVPAAKLAYAVPEMKEGEESRTFYYFDEDWGKKPEVFAEISSSARKFKAARKKRTPGALYFKKKP